MRHHFRVAAMPAVCLAAHGLRLIAFHWINQPRDSAVLGGIGLILAWLLIVPLVVCAIRRNL